LSVFTLQRRGQGVCWRRLGWCEVAQALGQIAKP